MAGNLVEEEIIRMLYGAVVELTRLGQYVYLGAESNQ